MPANHFDQAGPDYPQQRAGIAQFKQGRIDPSVRYEPAHAQQAGQRGTQEGDEHPKFIVCSAVFHVSQEDNETDCRIASKGEQRVPFRPRTIVEKKRAGEERRPAEADPSPARGTRTEHMRAMAAIRINA